jgi:phosphoserine phosphatase
MDGTLIDGRTIYEIGRHYSLLGKIKCQMRQRIIPYERSRRIAMMLKGLKFAEVMDIATSMPLMRGAERISAILREHGYHLGIISDSYSQIANKLCEKLGMDFAVANHLCVKDGKLTGGLSMPLGWEKIDCTCKQSVCKQYHLRKISESFGCDLEDTVAVGDNSGDLCMIENAGYSIAFQPKVSILRVMADVVVEEKNLHEVAKKILQRDNKIQ